MGGINGTIRRCAMQLIFTKGSGKYDRMVVMRDGVSVHTVDCPKQGIVPHDMVHYAVEHTLHHRGFLGRVRDGEAADFRMQAEAESDGVERLVEVIQGDAWSGAGSPAQELLELYDVTCRARECPRLPVNAGAIEAVRACFRDLTARWNAVPVGGALTLDFDVPR